MNKTSAEKLEEITEKRHIYEGTFICKKCGFEKTDEWWTQYKKEANQKRKVKLEEIIKEMGDATNLGNSEEGRYPCGCNTTISHSHLIAGHECECEKGTSS